MPPRRKKASQNLQSLTQRMTAVNRRRIDGALWLQEQMMTCRTLANLSLLCLPFPHSTAGIPRCREYMTQIEHDSLGIVHGYRRGSYVPRIQILRANFLYGVLRCASHGTANPEESLLCRVPRIHDADRTRIMVALSTVALSAAALSARSCQR